MPSTKRRPRELFAQRDRLAHRKLRRAVLWLAIPVLLLTWNVPIFCTYANLCSICGELAWETRIFRIPYSILRTEQRTDWNRWYRENVREAHDHRWTGARHAIWRNLFGFTLSTDSAVLLDKTSLIADEVGSFLDELAPYELDRPYFELLSHRDLAIRNLAVGSFARRPRDMTDAAAVQEWWRLVEAWAKDPHGSPPWK